MSPVVTHCFIFMCVEYVCISASMQRRRSDVLLSSYSLQKSGFEQLCDLAASQNNNFLELLTDRHEFYFILFFFFCKFWF